MSTPLLRMGVSQCAHSTPVTFVVVAVCALWWWSLLLATGPRRPNHRGSESAWPSIPIVRDVTRRRRSHAVNPFVAAQSGNYTLWPGTVYQCPGTAAPQGIYAPQQPFDMQVLNCSTVHSFGGTSTTTSFCFSYGAVFQCPDDSIVQSICAANATTPCPGGCADISVTCATAVSPTVSSESCEWRTMSDTAVKASSLYKPLAAVTCGADEVLGGVCLTDRGSERCFGGGKEYQTYAYCCFTAVNPCFPPPKWEKMGTSCASGGGVMGVCTGQCDTDDALAQRNSIASPSTPGFVPSMFFCHGTFLSRTDEWLRTGCVSTRTGCPGGYILMSLTTCAAGSGQVQLTCAKARFGVVSDRGCLRVSSNETAFCPQDYAVASIVCANRGFTCANATATTIECCPYRLYYQGGTPCRLGYVYTVLGTVSSRIVPYGVDKFPAGAIGLRLDADFQPFRANCRKCHVLYDAVLDDSNVNLFVVVGSIDTTLSPSPGNGYILRLPLGGLAPTTELVAGKITEYRKQDGSNYLNGYDNTNHVWANALDTTMAFATGYGGCLAQKEITLGKPLLLVAEGFFIREVDVTAEPRSVSLLAGVASATASPLVLDVPTSQSLFSDRIISMRFVPAMNQLYVATYTVIARDSVGRMERFCGTAGQALTLPTDAYSTTAAISCNTQKIGFANVMYVKSATEMYFTDGTPTYGGINLLDLDAKTVQQLSVQPPIDQPLGLTLYTPLNGMAPEFYVTGRGFSVYKVNSITLVSGILAGSQTQFSYVDRCPMVTARFSTLSYLAATRNQLFISDRDNGVVRATTLDPCSAAFNSSYNCQKCNTGFYHYPRCRDVCTIEDDCLSRATSVAGSQPDSCVCACVFPFKGNLCRDCGRGYDPRYACQACSPGYVGKWPNCRTKTATYSASETVTVLITHSRTPRPPPSKTDAQTVSQRTFSLTAEHTKSATRSRTPPPTATNVPPPTHSTSLSLTVSKTRKPKPAARRGGVLREIDIDEWKFFTFTVSPSKASATVSIQPTLTIMRKKRPKFKNDRGLAIYTWTPTPSPTASKLSPSATPSRTLRLTPTKYDSMTRKATTTKTAPRTRTPAPTFTRELATPPPNTTTGSTTLPQTSTTTRTRLTAPKITTTTTTTNTSTSTTTTTAAPLTELPMPTSPEEETDPPKPPGDQYVTLVEGGRLTVEALKTGLPIEERRLIFNITNGFFNRTMCRRERLGLVKFSATPTKSSTTSTADLDFLSDYAVSCNLTHLVVTFSVLDASKGTLSVDADPVVTVVVSRVVLFPVNVTNLNAKFTIITPRASAATETAQTAATATTTAIAVIGGGAGATQIQGLALATALSCASTSSKGATASARASISPWKIIDNDEIGYLLGNFVILVIGCALVGLATGGMFVKAKRDINSGAAQAEVEEFPDPLQDPNDIVNPLQRASVKVGFPGRFYTFVALTMQGICFESHLLLHMSEASIGARAFGALGLLYCLALPGLAIYFMRTRLGPARQCSYRYAPATFPFFVRPLLPGAFWAPAGFALRFGALFKNVRRSDIYFAAFDPFIKINITSFI